MMGRLQGGYPMQQKRPVGPNTVMLQQSESINVMQLPCPNAAASETLEQLHLKMKIPTTLITCL